MDGVDTSNLDCIHDNIAVLLHHGGILNADHIFASTWYFDFIADETAVTPIVPKLDYLALPERISYAGFELTEKKFREGDYISTITDLLAQGNPLIVFGDAFYMPWLHYYSREHHEHTIIIAGINSATKKIAIIDAFQNLTPWGTIHRQKKEISLTVLIEAIEKLQTTKRKSYYLLNKIGPQTSLGNEIIMNINSERIIQKVGEEQTISKFSSYYKERFMSREYLDQFVYSCWLTARARVNYHKWMSYIDSKMNTVSLINEFYETIVKPWNQVSTFAYVLSVKLDQYDRLPTSCFDLLEKRVEPAELAFAKKCLHLNDTQK
ncbi:hypothetical protein D3P09_21275 [Paenibacillus pinisoli]|uniref:Butirosin biosynthesis protein H N-terminal domain-containing protein n=1 Tax=Paenibacillus pinisoli TaxID=1276110 RepID=A0A3A6PAY4_9BACL|nr:BtrH N-terminal domain-containing protein [Paenibacillus pinisoli]RJX37517.1 hypothetical protein D3P09_21275 [Paenibacillus pinisoli]